MTRIRSDLTAPDFAVDALPEAKLTGEIIGAFYDVYNQLGYGFLESLYVAAMAIMLTERGFRIRREEAFEVLFHGQRIGSYRADLIVEDRVVLEIKAGAAIPPGSKAQLTNYLRITRIEVGLILFFGPEAVFKRVVLSRVKEHQT